MPTDCSANTTTQTDTKTQTNTDSKMMWQHLYKRVFNQ